MQVCPDLGHAVPLRRLLPEAEIIGADNVEISGFACDSRQGRQGELFAALQGSRHDGHDFIAEAVARGCAAVLIERPATSCGAGVPPALCSRDGCTTSYLPEVSVPVCMVPNV